MNQQKDRGLAYDLLHEAYEQQMEGDVESAVDLYQKSIDVCPTAEAHTFLGWAFSFQGKLDEAIEECKKAIRLDPEYGNPYNDIGAYLIEKSLYQEAIPWLVKAANSKRYESYHYAHYNLGRAYSGLSLLNRARTEFAKAMSINPDYELARDALAEVSRQIQ